MSCYHCAYLQINPAKREGELGRFYCELEQRTYDVRLGCNNNKLDKGRFWKLMQGIAAPSDTP